MSDAGLKGATVYHNLTPSQLYEKALTFEPGTHIMCNGALATLSGAAQVVSGLLQCRLGKPNASSCLESMMVGDQLLLHALHIVAGPQHVLCCKQILVTFSCSTQLWMPPVLLVHIACSSWVLLQAPRQGAAPRTSAWCASPAQSRTSGGTRYRHARCYAAAPAFGPQQGSAAVRAQEAGLPGSAGAGCALVCCVQAQLGSTGA